MSKAKEKILDCMFKLIAKYGYDNVTLTMICEMAKIDAIELGEYFQSKEEILLTILESIVDQGFAHTTIVVPAIKFTAQEYKEEFTDVFVGAIKKYESDVDFLKVVLEFYVQKNRLEAVKTLHETYSYNMKYYLKQALVRGVESKAFREDFDLELNVNLLYNTIIGIQNAIVYQLPIDYVAIWTATVKRLFE